MSKRPVLLPRAPQSSGSSTTGSTPTTSTPSSSSSAFASATTTAPTPSSTTATPSSSSTAGANPVNSTSPANPSTNSLPASPAGQLGYSSQGSNSSHHHQHHQHHQAHGLAPARPKRGELIFDCNFESGNLANVNRVSDIEYDLYIRPDTNNPRHRLWYYFSVSNARAGQRVILNIVNFSKTRSLYRLGMAPCVRSTSRPAWIRMHEKQAFYYKSARSKKQYVLSIVWQFDHDSDEYFFAYCFPYTYTFLQRFLHSLDCMRLPCFSRCVLTKTVLERNLDLVTISSPSNLPPQLAPGKRPKVIFLSGRVHPGETPSSYVVHGLINFLVSADPRAQLLRDHFVWKIAPMLNPDGVFLGNYRCSSLGHDLNRFWLAGDAWSHPTLDAVRTLLCELDRDPAVDLQFFIDVHAHSTGTNCFMYVNSAESESQRDRNMMFPRLFSLNSRDFSASSSRFCKDPQKAGTGRRAIGDFLSVNAHCYTLEVSFFCAMSARGKPVPFTQQSYLDLGRDLAMTFLDYYRIPHPHHP